MADEMDIDESQPRPGAFFDAAQTEQELDAKYPNRPHNHSKTLPFHDLYLTLFNPLNDTKKKPTGPAVNRRRLGPHSTNSTNPQEVKRAIIEKFISRWRQEVGDDIYPAFRLIIPEKDRDRAMYGLKEKAIGKLLVKVMKIDKNSEDGFNLLNWKLPGQSLSSRMAGDFAGRCYEVISKRAMLQQPGNLTIGEANDLLDKLSAAPREENQLPILEQFYKSMNADELLWLIRIILRQMKVGATERTFFDIWHPDAESLFNVSSSLRRVCWELHDPDLRLESEDRGVSLMQCYQPQLAQFQMNSFQRMVEKMRATEEDPTFWVEEKLDGERMQMHMVNDDSISGGKRFAFWSRKAKDYTYLYGNGFFDENGGLTRQLRHAFADSVDNIILDGEMITWDPEQDAPVPFGTLKTAALSEQRNPFSTGQRPLYRVFDILYLNDKVLTRYTLRDRRKALIASVQPIHRRFEVHEYQELTNAKEIEPLLRRVVAEASEGLVLKNPRSAYRLNSRNDDWIKVKPEYMTEFGESLDCIVIGGYYGSGHRGGNLSSFLCGLRVDGHQVIKGSNAQKCFSFFKVGGGFTAADYANIRHHTDNKWKDWDTKHPPTDLIELGGGDLQYERPDVYILPSDSVVLEVKAAQVTQTDQFRLGLTLRFPRFKRLRMDKTWDSALSIQEFLDLKSNVEQEQRDKQFKVDDARRQKRSRTTKKPLTVVGYDNAALSLDSLPSDHASSTLFSGLSFYIITESLFPAFKKSKPEIESLVKSHGGKIFQTHTAAPETVCIADRNTVKVASVKKGGKHDIIRPVWIYDCLQQARTATDRGLPDLLVPLEPTRHIFHLLDGSRDRVERNVDRYGDSYARDTGVEELRTLLEEMPKVERDDDEMLGEAEEAAATAYADLPGKIFKNCVLYFQTPVAAAAAAADDDISSYIVQTTARFAGASISTDLHDPKLTHVVVLPEHSRNNSATAEVRKQLSTYAGARPLPRIVTREWVEESWREETLLSEERFAVG